MKLVKMRWFWLVVVILVLIAVASAMVFTGNLTGKDALAFFGGPIGIALGMLVPKGEARK
jgi:hypothetical protein